jgi:hypothetical protein
MMEGEIPMVATESELPRSSRTISINRRFLSCRECGWVHYVMTEEEKTTNDRFLERYHLTEKERFLYESAFRQCLRCETPADAFRSAGEADLARATGHIVTPVLVEAMIGTQ